MKKTNTGYKTQWSFALSYFGDFRFFPAAAGLEHSAASAGSIRSPARSSGRRRVAYQQNLVWELYGQRDVGQQVQRSNP